MMHAKVVKPQMGRPDDETRCRLIEKDEVISGSLAKVAVRDKWARSVKSPQEQAAAEAAEKAD